MAGFFGLNQHIAIDLGTCTTKVYLRNHGIVVDEPTAIAINNDTGEVYAVGDRARKMAGKAPPNIEVIFPLKDGVISDISMVEKLMQYYIKIAYGRFRIFKPIIMVSVPCIMTDVEAKAVVDAAELAGARKVYLMREPVAVAMYSGKDLSKPNGVMVIDIGGGTSDYAVISLYGITLMHSVRTAGNRFDEDITRYVHKNFGLLIGPQTAEKIKWEIGIAYPGHAKKSMVVKGRDYLSGLPRSVTMNSDMVADAVSDAVQTITAAARSVIEKTPPELVADIKTNGILLSGGGSMLDGLDKYLETCLKTAVHRVQKPQDAVILGEAIALERVEHIVEGMYGLKLNRF